MLTINNIVATFNPSTIPDSKSIGYGTITIADAVSFNYSLYRSTKSALGFFVGLPSKRKTNPDGTVSYVNEVFIKPEYRSLIDEAVSRAMVNKGLDVSKVTAPPPSEDFSAYANQSSVPTPLPVVNQVIVEQPAPQSVQQNDIPSLPRYDELPF